MILDIPLIYLFNYLNIYPYYGAITSTIMGYSISILLIIIKLKNKYNFKFNKLFITIRKEIPSLIISFTFMMVLKLIIKSNYNRLIQIPILSLLLLISGSIYLFLTNKNKLLNSVLGDNLMQRVKSKISAKNM